MYDASVTEVSHILIFFTPSSANFAAKISAAFWVPP